MGCLGRIINIRPARGRPHPPLPQGGGGETPHSGTRHDGTGRSGMGEAGMGMGGCMGRGVAWDNVEAGADVTRDNWVFCRHYKQR